MRPAEASASWWQPHMPCWQELRNVEPSVFGFAVAVHPQDERYLHLIGKTLKLPLTERDIPIIADDYVDREFGTGCVKITPAHDFNDYAICERHGLPLIKSGISAVFENYKLDAIVYPTSPEPATLINPPEGQRTVTVRVGPAAAEGGGGAVVRVDVTDTGTGIKPDDLPKLFRHGFTTRSDGHAFQSRLVCSTRRPGSFWPASASRPPGFAWKASAWPRSSSTSSTSASCTPARWSRCARACSRSWRRRSASPTK